MQAGALLLIVGIVLLVGVVAVVWPARKPRP